MVVGGLLVLAITQQIREAETQERMRDSLRYFVRQVLTSQEDERKRIAMELHDDTAQALLLTCQRLDRLVADEGFRLPSRGVVGAARQCVPKRSGLSLTSAVSPSTCGRASSMITASSPPWSGSRIASSTSMALGLVCTWWEPCRSIRRRRSYSCSASPRRLCATWAGTQARPRPSSLCTAGAGRITMTVGDNGRGFRLAGSLSELGKKGKLGLLGMDERARLVGGTLDIRSMPGGGTTITVELPCTDPGFETHAPGSQPVPMVWIGAAFCRRTVLTRATRLRMG